MKRITPEQVVEAYKERGWKPVQDEFYCEIIGQPCGCGLAVMAGDQGDDVADYAEALELDYDYAKGFTRGWDGDFFYRDPTSHLQLGYEDGRAAWEAARREVGSA